MSKQRHTMIPRTGCLIFNQGKLLLIKYGASKGDRAGWYNWMGGHVEQGEGVIENAKREILEETGLTLEVKLKGVIHASNFFGKEIINYITISHSDTDQVVANDEGTLHRVDPATLSDYKIFEDVKVVLDEILKLKEGEVFTAKTLFDGGGSMIDFTME